MAKKAVETPLMKQYYQIKDKHPDAILLFRVGDFYETFAEDAVATAGILGITLTRRANGSAQFVELAGFPHHALDNYLPKLVRAGRRVAICDQLEDPKKTKKLVKRGITELVTPGVVMGDNVLRNKENNYLASMILSSDMKQAGLALLDISTGEFLCSEGTFDHVEKLLESYQPKELLLERQQRYKVEKMLKFSSFIFDLDDWAFSYENNRTRLLKHFGVQSLKGFGLEHLSFGISASGAILNYLELTSHTKLGHVTALKCLDRSQFMRLDTFTLRSLELIQSMNPHEGKSLLDIIDHTQTAMGGRQLRHWLVFPLLDLSLIQDRQQVVQALCEDSELHQDLRLSLSTIGDLERLASKLAVGRIAPREMNQLQTSLANLEEMKKRVRELGNSVLEKLVAQASDLSAVCQLIERTLLADAPIALGRGDVIARGVSQELDDLRDLAHGDKKYLSQIQERESEATGIPSLKIAFNNVFGYYLEVRNTHKDRVPEHWIRKQTLVNAERYIIPELKEYEEKILGAEERISMIEFELFNQLVEAVAKHIHEIQRSSQMVATLDCLSAFAEGAIRYHYVCPKLNNGNTIQIKAGRHPVIEQQLPLGESYVPNDVLLDNDGVQIMVITGPNMSGKSALLRQTALIMLLAQIGAFVPADEAELGLVDAIFTRVGASDNISRGESTFMVEMQEASSILNNLTPRSLILFDELGRGTSTYDGISIAWSIIEYLHNNRHAHAKTLFATHYHELNDLETRLERVKNFNVSAQEVDGQMLFLRKLVEGGSEHSFGIQVARLGGMPMPIVQRASSILQQLEQAHGGANSEVEAIADKIQASRKDLVPEHSPSSESDTYQLSLFQLDDPVLSQIRDLVLELDVNNLTPLEALNKLNDIQSVLKTPESL